MQGNLPLSDLKILDISTMLAGPWAATILSDYGADVVKIEHPRGDPARWHGPSKDGINLGWKRIARNKSCITLNLNTPDGAELFLRLVESADVVLENFRPGTLERWHLGYDALSARNPKIILARVTGFGQVGPMAGRAGFGTLAESMSGFAHMTGQPDGPPTLPPFGLADSISSMATAIAILTAVHARQSTGKGQVIDVAIIEPILHAIGSQPTEYDQIGRVQGRTGNRAINNAPRNLYRSSDGRWLGVSTSAQSIAERVMRLIGRPELIDEPWFATAGTRAQHVDELDDAVGSWIAQRSAAEVIEQFEAAGAAVAPVYDVADIMADPQYNAINAITTVDDEDLGPVKMQNMMFRLSETPGRIRWAGKSVLGADNAAVYLELGLSDDKIAELRDQGVI
jgi:crotonobetainyl-CoA:carnitine CoA-transferase CaiB-like acyl-CoA transferase